MIWMSRASSQGPNQPRAPNISTKDSPAMTGETEKGRSISAVSSRLPGKSNFAMHQAAASPPTRFTGTVIAATSRVSQMAATVSGFRRAPPAPPARRAAAPR